MKSHIQLEKSDQYERVITCGAPERAKKIAFYLENSECIAQNREYHSYLGQFEGKPVLVTSHGVGASGASICFRELINAGAKKIVRIGTAGGLYDPTQIGDIVVATSAIRQDGVSQLMVPLEVPAVADLEFTQALLDEFQKAKTPVRAGMVVTSDLFYPEGMDTKLELYSRLGAIAVEMECSALFILGHLHQVKTGSVLILDGNPLKWDDGLYDPASDEMVRSIEKAIQSTLRAIVRD
jgi:uridine phosphorylase